jgi:pilus assembly protein CpaC
VTVGKETVLKLNKPIKSISRVSLADEDIADIKPLISTSPDEVEIIINGKKPGVTSLIVWDTKGKTFFDVIVMEKMDTEMTYGEKIEALKKEIKAVAPNDDIRVSLANDTILLSGYAANQETIDKALQIAQAYAIASSVSTSTNYSSGLTTTTTSSTGKVLNHIQIKEASQVLLEVKVAQIDKDALKKLGINTLVKGSSAEGFVNNVGAPTSIGGSTGGEGISGIATGQYGIVGNTPGIGSYYPLDTYQIGVSYFPSGIGTVLQVLSSKNLAKVLAEPNLLVKSGQKGEFLAGSQIPIPVVTGSTTGFSTITLEYRDVGIKLNFAPEVTESGTIFLKIDPAEISNISGTIRVAGLESPMIDTREVRTAVELKEGESLILAGLLQEEMVKTMQKIPILGDIPILGAFFRSTSDELKHKELAFFITPKLIKPIPRGVKTALPTDNRPTPEEEQEFQWIPLPKKSDSTGKANK